MVSSQTNTRSWPTRLSTDMWTQDPRMDNSRGYSQQQPAISWSEFSLLRTIQNCGSVSLCEQTIWYLDIFRCSNLCLVPFWRSLEVRNGCLLRNYQQVACRRKGSVTWTCKTEYSQIPAGNVGSKPCLRRASSSTRMMRNSLQEGWLSYQVLWSGIVGAAKAMLDLVPVVSPFNSTSKWEGTVSWGPPWLMDPHILTWGWFTIVFFSCLLSHFQEIIKHLRIIPKLSAHLSQFGNPPTWGQPSQAWCARPLWTWLASARRAREVGDWTWSRRGSQRMLGVWVLSHNIAPTQPFWVQWKMPWLDYI